LNHPLGGKTGTTSDYTDAWFLGFSPSVTCGVWVGFDSRQSLGEKETGARAALPIWMQIMKVAIYGKDDEQFPGEVEDSSIIKTSQEQPANPLLQPASTPALRSQSVNPLSIVTTKSASKTPQSPALLSGNMSAPATSAATGLNPVHQSIPVTKPALTRAPNPKPQLNGPHTPGVH
jgi:penicillin-binding protein 1A